MKAYKVTLLVVDHDKIGGAGIKDHIENMRYPNHCINPIVVDVEERDVGVWNDDHPLNQTMTMKREFREIFDPAVPIVAVFRETLAWISTHCTHRQSAVFAARALHHGEAPK